MQFNHSIMIDYCRIVRLGSGSVLPPRRARLSNFPVSTFSSCLFMVVILIRRGGLCRRRRLCGLLLLTVQERSNYRGLPFRFPAQLSPGATKTLVASIIGRRRKEKAMAMTGRKWQNKQFHLEKNVTSPKDQSGSLSIADNYTFTTACNVVLLVLSGDDSGPP